MCLGEYGTVIGLLGPASAEVCFGDGSCREVSLAVLVAEGVAVRPGDTVAVSIGMALHVADDDQEALT
ncbi:MAG: HypC/HybG/HupF family hydrogenase formation chaperone [Ilumatobacteraceae bacterium]